MYFRIYSTLIPCIPGKTSLKAISLLKDLLALSCVALIPPPSPSPSTHSHHNTIYHQRNLEEHATHDAHAHSDKKNTRTLSPPFPLYSPVVYNGIAFQPSLSFTSPSFSFLTSVVVRTQNMCVCLCVCVYALSVRPSLNLSVQTYTTVVGIMSLQTV